MTKVCTMGGAISRFAPDGAAAVMGCGLESAIPFAAGHELIRQRRADLTPAIARFDPEGRWTGP